MKKVFYQKRKGFYLASIAAKYCCTFFLYRGFLLQKVFLFKISFPWWNVHRIIIFSLFSSCFALHYAVSSLSLLATLPLYNQFCVYVCFCFFIIWWYLVFSPERVVVLFQKIVINLPRSYIVKENHSGSISVSTLGEN